MLHSFVLELLLFVILSQLTDGHHHILILITGHTNRESRRIPRALSLLMAGNRESCADAEQVTNPVEVQFPRRYHRIRRPWTQSDTHIKLYTSQNLLYNWLWIKALSVKGLGEVTVDDVITKLESNGCFFIPWGNSVLRALLGAKPSDLGGEVTCTTEQVREICIKNFGPSSCVPGLRNTKTHLVIGNSNQPVRKNELIVDPITVSHWNSLHNKNSTQWDYTVDSLGLLDNHHGKVYLIDASGRGLKDTCTRSIDFIAEKSDWEACCGQNVNKLLRYYVLRLLGFRPGSEEILNFIKDHIKHAVTAQKLQNFLCTQVAKGKWKSRYSKDPSGSITVKKTSTCFISPGDKEAKDSISEVEQMMKVDFGEFYQRTLRPAAQSMEITTELPENINFNEDDYSDDDHQGIHNVKTNNHADRIHETAPDEMTDDARNLSESTVTPTATRAATRTGTALATTPTIRRKATHPTREFTNRTKNISLAVILDDEPGEDDGLSASDAIGPGENSQNDMHAKREFAADIMAPAMNDVSVTRSTANSCPGRFLYLLLLMLPMYRRIM